MLAKDYKDMLTALDNAGAEYIVVGAYALAGHGNVRATGDIDVWIRPTPDNAQRVWNALVAYKAPRRNLTVEDLFAPDTVYQIGLSPYRIDFLTSISGVDFDSAWRNRVHARLEDYQVVILGKQDMLTNKRAAGRPKDLVDVAWLEEQA